MQNPQQNTAHTLTHTLDDKTIMAVSIMAEGIRKRCRKTSREYLEKFDMDFPQDNARQFYQQNKHMLHAKAKKAIAEKMKQVDKVYITMIPTVIEYNRGYPIRTCELLSGKNLRIVINV